MLLCDFSNLEREVEALVAAGAPGLHLDVMDGAFVPNMTYGMPLVAAFRKLTDLPLDVHLMVERPERYISEFEQAGADSITIHIEATPNAVEVLQEIRELGLASGIALNPGTPVDAVAACLPHSDLALVMSVEAGFGGQSFQRSALEKLHTLRELAGPDLILEVDGGINDGTISECGRAGAELFVVGSGIFRGSSHELETSYREAITRLRELATA